MKMIMGTKKLKFNRCIFTEENILLNKMADKKNPEESTETNPRRKVKRNKLFSSNRLKKNRVIN